MQTTTKLPYLTLVLMISFASVNAVLFTPALPSIAEFFHITADKAQYTITWFLVGYAVGQLIYGPLANRFGRKPALYIGVVLQIVGCLLCILSAWFEAYNILIFSRFLLALGSGVGLKMTYTLVNECYEPKAASQKLSYLMLAFAITPGLAVAIGGVLTTYCGWTSCFYLLAIYGVLLLFLISNLPETKLELDYNALKIKNLITGYQAQFTNLSLLSSGVLMGMSTSYIYVFAALAPFVAINMFGMSETYYGLANMLPPMGLIIGSLTSSALIKKYSLQKVILIGILIAAIGVICMLIAMILHLSALRSVFFPAIMIYVGLCLIPANAASIALGKVADKSQGSAVINFMNMGMATVTVLIIGYFPIQRLLLPEIYAVLCVVMMLIYHYAIRSEIR